MKILNLCLKQYKSLFVKLYLRIKMYLSFIKFCYLQICSLG